jgi:hypothetical protein
VRREEFKEYKEFKEKNAGIAGSGLKKCSNLTPPFHSSNSPPLQYSITPVF